MSTDVPITDEQVSTRTSRLRPVASLLYHYWPLLMVVVGFSVRLIIVLVHQPLHFSTTEFLIRSGGETGNIAASVAQGHGFSSPYGGVTGPTALIPPVYVYLCAAVFKLFGVFSQASQTILLSINCFLSALNAAVIYILGSRSFDRKTGLWAGWCWAVLPPFMAVSTTLVWDTTLSALLMTLVLLFTIELCEGGAGIGRWIGYGVFWGFSALTNPALLSFLPIALVWIAWHKHRRNVGYARAIAVTVLLCVLTISPWLVRNRVVFGQWVFIRSNFALEFYLANHLPAEGEGEGAKHPYGNRVEYEKYKTMGELAYIDSRKHEAIEYVRTSPGRFLSKTAARIVDVWTGGIFEYLRRWNAPPLAVQAQALLSLLALFGLALAAFRRMRDWLCYVGLVLAFPLPYYLTYSGRRFIHPIEPVLLLVATYFLVQATRELSTKAG